MRSMRRGDRDRLLSVMPERSVLHTRNVLLDSFAGVHVSAECNLHAAEGLSAQSLSVSWSAGFGTRPTPRPPPSHLIHTPRTHPPSKQSYFSAHPTTDVSTGETFNIGIGGKKGAVEVMRLSPDGTLDKSTSFTPPASLFWHDNTITEEYVVAVTSPFVATLKSILKALLGFGQLGKAFKWDDSLKAEVW